mgnify:CR=1 FL=1
MTSDKFISSITNEVYNRVRKSSSDAEARRCLKEHQAKQLSLTDVVKSFYCHDHKWTTNAPRCEEQCKYCTDLKK